MISALLRRDILRTHPGARLHNDDCRRCVFPDLVRDADDEPEDHG